MVGCDASDWSSGLAPFAPMMNTEMRHLFDGEHWEIAPIRSLALFFRALTSLVPGDSLLCLAEGSWDEEIIDFFNKYRIQPPAGIVRPGEFEDGAHLPVEQTVLDALAALQNTMQGRRLRCISRSRITHRNSWNGLTFRPILSRSPSVSQSQLLTPSVPKLASAI